MTEAEKDRQLRLLLARADIAEKNGLPQTARSWRDYVANVAARPASEIIFANRSGSVTDESQSIAPRR
jgi:hypothetical protein